ncbi:MAG: lamin tail domain-containing protein [Anaerolineae bacterium]
MQRRSLLMFILLTALISAAATFVVLNALNPNSQTPTTSQVVITVPILVTATTDPLMTPRVIIITATPPPGQVILPTGVLPADANGTSEPPLATFDAQALNPVENTQGAAATVLPENCILYTLVEGDTPFAVAEQFGADPFRLMEVNGLNDETASLLQIGESLIVPLDGCPLEGPQATAAPTLDPAAEANTPTSESATAEATEGATATPTLRPTLTLPPTATNAQVEIAEVVGAGSINTEGIVLRNNGSNVNLKGWTITTSSGNTYTFAERIFFSNGLVTIYSRVGQDTAIALFWNRTQPAFQAGDVVTLKNEQGQVQGSFRLPAPQPLP